MLVLVCAIESDICIVFYFSLHVGVNEDKAAHFSNQVYHRNLSYAVKIVSVDLVAEYLRSGLRLYCLPLLSHISFWLQWKVHYAVLSRVAVGQTLMVNQLVDMEWKFGG